MDRPRSVPQPPASEALFEAHHAAILRLCRAYLRDDAEAEDATQETFLAAHKSLLGGATPEHEAAWLAAIARHTCWQRLQRRERDRLGVAGLDAPPDEADAYTATIRRGEGEELLKALGELPEQQQKAFVLYEVAGHSYAEAASRLDVSESALDALLVRARRRLRSLLEVRLGVIGAPLAYIFRLAPEADSGGAASGAAKVGALSLAAKLTAVGVGATLLGGSAIIGQSVHARPFRIAHAATHVHVSVTPPVRRIPSAHLVSVASTPVRAESEARSDRANSPVAPSISRREPVPTDRAETSGDSQERTTAVTTAGFSHESRSMTEEPPRTSPENEGESD